MSERAVRRIPCPVLVGRERALALLRERVEGLNGIEVVLIAGEAGIGKSRIAAEAGAYAAGRQMQVLRCECLPNDRTRPFAPLLAMLRARLRALPPAAAAALVAPFARELAPLLPEWAQPEPAAAREAPPLDAARLRRFAAFAHCLLGQDGPRLLIVEDLHWCDDESLEALLFLLREAGGPLLLVGTFRDDEPSAGLQAWKLQLTRARLATELRPQPLTREQVLAMIGAIVGGDEQVHQACCDTIYPLAEGKPFYVEELLRALLDAGDLAADDGGWRFTRPAAPRLPQSLSGLIQLRVEGLTPEARELLAVAAVIGRRFDLALLERVARVAEPELLRRIKELVAAQLVAEEAPDSFAFRHALTQQAIYGGLLTRERRALHEAVAAALEAEAQGGPEEQLGALARHYAGAERWPQALAYAGWAGERAQRLHAPRAAVALYSLALDAAAALGRPASARAPRLQLAPARLHLARGQAHEMLGAFEAAQGDYERALEQARASDDAETEWAALSDTGTLWSGRDYGRAGERWREALALARALGRPALVAHSLNRVGSWLVNTGRPQEGLGLHHEALQIFEGLEDRGGAAQTLERLGMASYLGADVAASAGFYERAAARFAALGDRYGQVASLVMTMSTRAGSLFFDPLGDDPGGFPQALADGERALALARELGWRAGEAFALWTLASLLGHHGAYGRAIELAQRGRQLAEAIGHTQWAASSRWMLGMLHLDLLAPRAACAELEAALALAQSTGSAVWTQHAASALAVAYLRAHERERAERLLGSIFGAGQPDAWSGQAALLWARASLALARRDGAAALRLLEGAGLSGPAAPGRETTRLLLARGEALAALGRGEEAEALLGGLRDLARRQGARAPLLAAHLALGGLSHGARQADKAQREYDAARQLAEALAAELPEGALRAGFLRGVAGRIPARYASSSRRARAARFDGLTARELEVAGLVARGRSNREIAEELVIGERTVETHISNIFAKLRAASRQEVAAWARRKGLPT